MRAALRVSIVPLLLAPALSAQQLLWQVPAVPPWTTYARTMAPFGDYDGDGYRDYLHTEQLVFPFLPLVVQIRSGVDGSVLWQLVSNVYHAVSAGDVDGDGNLDVAVLEVCCPYPRTVRIWSPATNQVLWLAGGSFSGKYGGAMLGDIDVNGDGFDDFLVAKTHPNESEVFVYNHQGTVLYSYPMTPIGWTALSLAKMGDMDGDGCDDFLMGCAEPSGRGALVLVSGLTGSVLRISYGLLVGDVLAHQATNLGDIDGDGVNDYVGFAYGSALRSIGVAFSGATGNVIRTWPLSTDSVIATEDLDLDGVPDLVIAGDFPVNPPNVYGRTYAFSGRDGTVLWTVDNFQGSGQGSSGFARYAGGLGVLPGSPYPAIAWLDLLYYQSPSTGSGRVRAFRGTRAGQGPVTGTPCSSSTTMPQIGVRETTAGARITIANGPPGGLGLLALALGNPTSFAGHPLPLSLDAIGLLGCELYVSPDFLEVRALGTTGIDAGYAAVDLSVNCAPAGLGTIVSAQWLAFDPATGGYAATHKHQLRLL